MSESGKRIGFVDNSLENFHSNTYLKLLREDLKDRGFTVTGGIGLKEAESKAWAEANGVPYFSKMKALDGVVDHYIVLAPSDPEVHLKLCKMVFPFGKPTYVDKTFAPDLKTARKIFALADKHKVPMQTTSALRYTNVQDYVQEVGSKEVKHMVTWGGGSSFGEYAIHPVELAISCMGPKVRRLMRQGKGDHAQLLLWFSGGRTAVINVYTNQSTPYAASVTTKKGTQLIQVESAKIFLNTAAAILDMFESGEPNISRKESLMIRRILDVAGEKDSLKGFVKV
jgi:predicted dehydrogenase